MENNNIKILRDKLLDSFGEQYKTNLQNMLKYSRHPTMMDAYYELSRTEVLFLSFLEALWSENVELSLGFLREIDQWKLFPHITFYMGGKLHTEFDLPTELLEKALKFATSLKESGLVEVPDCIIQYLAFLVKRWKGILPKDQRLVSIDETYNISETKLVSQFCEPQMNSVNAIDKDILRRSNHHSKKFRSINCHSKKSHLPQSQSHQTVAQHSAKADISLGTPVPFNYQVLSSPKIDHEFILDPIANALVTSASFCPRACSKNIIRTKYATRDLFFAIGRNDPVATQLAINNGADLEERCDGGFSPLHIAARGGCERIVSILIRSGANLNCRNSTGSTPLHLAVLNGNEKVVKLLVMANAHLNAEDNYGNTPLHEAAARGNLKIVQFLVTNGALVNCKTQFGETPIAIALLWNQQSTAAYLSQIGGIN